MTETQQEAIADLIKQGYTSGRVDDDNSKIAWELTTTDIDGE